MTTDSLITINDSVAGANGIVHASQPLTATVTDSTLAVSDSATGVHDTIGYFYDTLMQSLQPMPTHEVQSLFRHHLLPVIHSEAIPRTVSHPTIWCVLVVMVGLIGLLLYIGSLHCKPKELLQATFKKPHRTYSAHESTRITLPQMVPIAFLCLIPMILILLHLLQPQMELTWVGLLEYLKWLALACVIYFARNAVILLFGKAFNNEEAANAYMASNYLFHLYYGIVGLALATFILYVPWMEQACLWVLAVVLAGLFVIRLVRGMIITLTQAKNSKVYFFYYFCIFEIVPIVVITKLAISCRTI